MSRGNCMVILFMLSHELSANDRLEKFRRIQQWDQIYVMKHVGDAPYSGLDYQ